MGRAELYSIFGHDKSLKGVTLQEHHYSLYRGEKNVTKWQVEQRRGKGARSWLSNMPTELAVGDTKEEVLARFAEKYATLGERDTSRKNVPWIVYTKRGESGRYFVGKKMGSQYLDLLEFDSVTEARKVISETPGVVEEAFRRKTNIPNERREFNKERIGPDTRKGKDVTPKMFTDTFGFKGVEFGNWVTDKERQDNLNRAYDSLVDLATVLGIPTRALSLNGELGLGFGSRGMGGTNAAAAHYEAGHIAINLTRKNGPGSLAHEWMHAMDNYLSRRRGKPDRFVTEQPFLMGDETTRKELVDALVGVNDAINATGLEARSKEMDKRRTKAYWSQRLEMAARAFESYVIEKLGDAGASNDYLANIATSPEYAQAVMAAQGEAVDMYPYLLDSEIPGVKKAFDKLFETVETREEGDKTVLFQRKVVDEAPEVATVLTPETKADFLLRMVQDKHRRLFKVQKAVAPKGITEDQDAYLRQELIHGRTEARLNEFKDSYITPLQKAMVKAGVSLEEVEDYAYAEHAPERNEYIAGIRPEFVEKGIAGSGMTDETAAAIIVQAKEEGKQESLKELAKMVRSMNEIARGVLLEGGLISAEEKAGWERFENYVTLQGIDEKESRPRVGRGFDVRGKESKRMLGRKSKARNLLSHTIEQTTVAIIRAEKNRVSQSFLAFVRENPDPNLWEIDKVVQKPTFNKSKGEVVYAIDQRYQLADEVMSVKEGGQEFHITIHDPALAAGMKNLGASSASKVLQVMGAFNRYLAMVNTSLSAGFMPTNFARDLQTALINAGGMEGMTAKESLSLAGSILKNIPQSAKGVYQGMNKKQTKWADWYREFEQVGGKVGFFGLKDVDQIQRELMGDIAMLKPGVPATARKMFRSTLDFIMDANAIVENSTRLATYVAMRERGMSAERSASVAKNITVNFNRKGELGSLINSLYIFSNASIQGTARLAVAMKNPRTWGIVSTIGVGSFMAAGLMRTLGGDDPDDGEPYYDKIPDWVKQNNMIMMLPDTKGKYMKIPVPYGYNVFWAIGQAVDKAVSHPTKRGALEGAAMIGGALAQSFNPMGDAPSLLQTISPTFVRPFVDLQLNQNFAGQPIMREEKYGPTKARAETFGKGTTEVSKAVTKALNQITGGTRHQPGLVDVHPDLLDYMVEYAGGGFGRTAMQIVSGAAKIATNKPIPVRSIPIVRRFIAEQYDYQAQSTFYDYQDRIESIRADYEHFKDTDPKKAVEFKKKNAKALSMSNKRKMVVRGKSGSRQVETTLANKQQKEMRVLREKIKAAELKNNQALADKYGELLTKKVKGYNRTLRSIRELN